MDDEDFEELAELYGVELELVEALYEEIERRAKLKRRRMRMIPTVGKTKRGFDIPDPDYMLEYAEAVDINVSDLYDMYYGYEPGYRGRH